MVEQLTEKSLPFFIYAVEHIPLSEQEETELHDLKKMLPEAAILFIKAEIGTDSKEGFKNFDSCYIVSK